MLELAGFDVLDAARVVLAGLVVETELETNGELDELDFDDVTGVDVDVVMGFTVEDAKTEMVLEALEDTNRLLDVLALPVPAF